MLTDNPDHERALREHIDYVVGDYALEHICRDHVQYSHEAVSSILSRILKPVPLIPKTQLILPDDPFDRLRRDWDLEACRSCYDPKWTVDDPREVADHMRRLMTVKKRSRADTIWEEKDPWDSIYNIYRQAEKPIVTRRAILKKDGPTNTKLSSFKDLCKENSTLKPPLAPIPTDESDTVDQDTVLNLRPVITEDERVEILKIVRESVLGTKGKPGTTVPTPVQEFLNRQSPPPKLPPRFYPPLFPRTHWQEKGKESHEKKGISFLSKEKMLLPTDLVEDLPKALMERDEMHLMTGKVVDGWNILEAAYPHSSSREPTPDLIPPTSSVRSEDWKRFMPLTPPPATNAAPAYPKRVDEILFPRISKEKMQGGELAKAKSFRDVPSLIPPRLERSFGEDETTVDAQADNKDGLAVSIRARASSATREGEGEGTHVEEPEIQPAQDRPLNGDLGTWIMDMCDRNIGSLAYNYLLEEKLDEKHAFLRDVPRLQNPPFNNSKMPAYTDLASLVLKEKTFSNADGKKDKVGFLKKLGGLQSLNLELSWRPFTYGTHIPTHAELSNVQFPTLTREEIEAVAIFSGDVLREPDGGSYALWGKMAKKWDESESRVLEKLMQNLREGEEHKYLHNRRERERLAGRKVGSQGGASGELLSTMAVMQKRPVEMLGTIDEFTGDLLNQGRISAWNDSFTPSKRRRQEDAKDESSNLPLFLSSPDDDTLLTPAHDQLGLDDLLDNRAFRSAYHLTLPFTQDDKGITPEYPESSYQPLAQPVFTPHIRQDDISSSLPSLELPQTGRQLSLPQPAPDVSSPSPEARVKTIAPRLTLLSEVPSVHPPLTKTSLNRAPLADVGNLRNLSSVKDGLNHFLRLRGQQVSDAHGTGAPLESSPPVALPVPQILPRRSIMDEPIPDELIRFGELQYSPLSATSDLPADVHRYVISLSMIQKRVLTSTMVNTQSVHLVERATLEKPDLVLDPFSCIILYPLAHLPSSGEALLEDICRFSWSYSRITVLFEAYSEWKSIRPPKPQAGDTEDLEPYPFSPPVLKAVRTLRRGLGMSDGSGTKDVECHVSFAFGRNVEEGARVIRAAGEYAKRMAFEEGGGAVWDDRSWLTAEEWEDEDLLASHPGMNILAAIAVLSRVDLNAFLQMSANDRMSFAGLIGMKRVMQLNTMIESRLKDFQASSSPSL